MTEKDPDVTTKAANTISRIAYAVAALGSLGFIIGVAALLFGGGDAGIMTACLFGGGFAATTGLLMITIQSCTMLIIREMWAIEHDRHDR